MKFYFVFFLNQNKPGLPWQPYRTITKNLHPLQWEIDCNERHTDRYKVISWQEITEDEFNQFAGCIE